MTTPGEWDAAAERFDAEPDHGLTDPALCGRPVDDERFLVLSRR